MTTDAAPPLFHLHFEGEAARGHTVPASASWRLGALQRAIHLLAFAHEGRDFKERLRVGAELDRKYAVIFKVPEDGGYDIPYVIGNTARTLLEPEDIATVTAQHLASSTRFGIMTTKPSDQLFRLHHSGGNTLQPSKTCSLQSARGSSSASRTPARQSSWTATQRPNVSSRCSPSQITPSVQPRVVTGRLDALDFQARKLTLALFTGRHLDCVYGDDFETALVENLARVGFRSAVKLS